MQSPEWQAEWIPTGPVTPVYLPRVPPPCSPSESDLEAQLELVGDDSFGRNLSREATISQLHSIGTIQTGSACSMRAWATPPPPDILWRRGGGEGDGLTADATPVALDPPGACWPFNQPPPPI